MFDNTQTKAFRRVAIYLLLLRESLHIRPYISPARKGFTSANWGLTLFHFMVNFTKRTTNCYILLGFDCRMRNAKYARKKYGNGIWPHTSRPTANSKACLANFVARNTRRLEASHGTKRFIWTWKSISVVSVANVLSKRPTCRLTSEYTLGKGLTSVSFATKALCNQRGEDNMRPLAKCAAANFFEKKAEHLFPFTVFLEVQTSRVTSAK